MCFNESIFDALHHPNTGLAPLRFAVDAHATVGKRVDKSGNHVTVTAQHGTIGH